MLEIPSHVFSVNTLRQLPITLHSKKLQVKSNQEQKKERDL